MQNTSTRLNGIWLPLVTPFREGALDGESVRRLVRHYAGLPVEGLILAATTGEGLTLDHSEAGRLVSLADEVRSETSRRMPLWLGLSGADTRRMATALRATEQWPVDGYLIAVPYYSKPSQEGLFAHFATLAGSTHRPIALYNIPYRTGVSLGTETILRLAELPNVIALKDCGRDSDQTLDLLCHRPAGFSILTGEDALFYTAIAQGADGGILASGHVETAAWASLRYAVEAGDRTRALRWWRDLVTIARLLFAEPGPAPVKYYLWRLGLISSPEVRLPLSSISADLAARIDRHLNDLSRFRRLNLIRSGGGEGKY